RTKSASSTPRAKARTWRPARCTLAAAITSSSTNCITRPSSAAGVDAMAVGTYEWLLGAYGVAPFYVRREVLERLTLDRFGALHVEKELPTRQFEIYKTTRRFDYATLAFEPVYQLGAAIAYLA